MSEIALVAVEKTSYTFDTLFSYLIPKALEGRVKVGMRVLVPFGKGDRKLIAMVFARTQASEESENTLKSIANLVDVQPVLNTEQLEIAKWLRDNTFCTYFDAVKSIMPSGLGMLVLKYYAFQKPDDTQVFSHEEQEVIDSLTSFTKEKEISTFLNELEAQNEQLFKSLLNKKVIRRGELTKQKIGAETLRMVRLSDNIDVDKIEGRNTPKQRAVYDMLCECTSASVREVCYNCTVTPAVVNNLIKKGVLEEFTNEISRSTIKDRVAEKSLDDLVFSDEQQAVFEGLRELMDMDTPQCALLRGVTGSGKTSVFIKLIERALGLGKTALLLVPEIALTPQMTDNFTALFGGKVAIIHSGLSLGQRNDEYKRIEKGEATIVIGTRSAVFAPLDNIGIIVIDEEGESSYKSERSPRYHARDVAKLRAVYHKALLLLASATPSLQSYHHAVTGRYKLFELEKRYSKAVLPDVYIVDMKMEAALGNRGNFSQRLLEEIDYNLSRGEQSMVLLNRRGYHTYANCISCGAVLECPNCAVSLTYHKSNETVQCHYCGYTKPMPERCEKCGSKFIRQSGTGTQRVEEELHELFPSARILRMDADTTMTKGAYERGFKSFASGDYDIMIGTQMIAKGLDFENVTLVGVLLIDKSLYAGDYLGYERTFSLVTQVVGRSGRGSKKGRAYLQTFTPDHYVLELAAQQNYKEFYRQEIDVRKALTFPPFCDIFYVGFSSANEQSSFDAAGRFVQLFSQQIKDYRYPYRVLSPTKNTVARVNGKYRHRVIIKGKNHELFRQIMEKTIKLAAKSKEFKNVSFFVDINGEIF